MYLDLIVLIVLFVVVIIYSRRFQTYIFGFGMIDILFRILNIIKSFIPISEVRKFISTYVPSSVPGVINRYTSGLINNVLIWVYVIIMGIFLYFIVKIFIKRKKFWFFLFLW